MRQTGLKRGQNNGVRCSNAHTAFHLLLSYTTCAASNCFVITLQNVSAKLYVAQAIIVFKQLIRKMRLEKKVFEKGRLP